MNHLDNNSDRSVVVTGMGVVTPNGENASAFLDSLTSGRSAITRWKRDSDRMASKIGGDLSAFDICAHLERVGENYPARLK